MKKLILLISAVALIAMVSCGDAPKKDACSKAKTEVAADCKGDCGSCESACKKDSTACKGDCNSECTGDCDKCKGEKKEGCKNAEAGCKKTCPAK